MKSGVLCLYKEKGFTSHDAVARIRRLYGTKKVGHTGTLDPQATGVLPILIGSAVKACDLIPEHSKIYRATLRFGLSTDTQDIWGKVLKTSDERPKREALEEGVRHFLGEGEQVPPMVSAVKIGGKKLYEYARQGIEIDRPARPIFVHSFSVTDFSGEEACLTAHVSKGTYIRTLLTDLCEYLGCLGTMSALERVQSGMFSLDRAVTLSDLEEMSPEEREGVLCPVEDVFSSLPVYRLPAFFDRLIENGLRVNTNKLGLADAPCGARFRLYQDGVFVGIGEIASEEGETVLFRKKAFPSDGEEN